MPIRLTQSVIQEKLNNKFMFGSIINITDFITVKFSWDDPLINLMGKYLSIYRRIGFGNYSNEGIDKWLNIKLRHCEGFLKWTFSF